MSDDIQEAKRRVPLPVLMHRLGLGQHAKKRAFCPFQDRKSTRLNSSHSGETRMPSSA